MGKLTITVLIIWVGIGVSLAALYPLSENIQDQQTGFGPGNLQLNPDLNEPQENNDSRSSQSNSGSENLIMGYGSGISQSSSDKSQNNNNTGNSKPDNSSQNKYLVDHFILNIIGLNFTAEITNPKNRVIGDGYFEIKTRPSANHGAVLQFGTFPHSNGTFTIGDSLTFTPTEDKYYILVYTNYPDNNRVDKTQNESGTD
ncbi:hypothetical protein [Methanobacterium petrolearium]|uniref:hypothetical protein n=1 Tax=Methanobacterium petrolearium TaxID=710190 RepID=UPI001AE30C12|nr:hypothetical protein [Methanobacterium petrolearium]MBP1946422.1 hypothetical protein [Methanobacterium petrolearium]